jgi:probable HAF family extracellular repeat protein
MVQPFEGMPYRRRGVSLLIGFWLAFSPLGGEAQQLRWLGVLSDGFQSGAWDVTPDGATVVGWATVAMFRAFRWTPATGMQDLGTLGGSMSEAYGVSADGAVIVGYAVDYLDRMRAFRWTEATGMQDLGTFGGAYGAATDVSADGRVIVGWAANAAWADPCLPLDGGDRLAGDWGAAWGHIK